MLKHIVTVIALIILITSTVGASIGSSIEKENFYNEDSGMSGFSKIYVDGFGVNSNGFKLILRTYERHAETNFKPFLADIEYILIKQGQVVYSKRVEQIPLSVGSEGNIILDHQGTVALEEGKNYTGMAKVYLYRDGSPEYYLTTSSNFTARNDAEITEVYGDGIGASATIKSISMVPLNAKIIFTLKQGGRVVETREIAATSIMSNDKEKTVNILWTNNLGEGTYIVSVSLHGKDLTASYDKIFTVDKRTSAKTAETANQSGKPGDSYNTPGFTLIIPVIAISALVLIYKRRN
ncbi:MAG: hypothetical protein OIN66_05125 [Candidatus Methanoperedens sp.]|nr:hypothetical protein [Candidatus Methanoperedens sp.]